MPFRTSVPERAGYAERRQNDGPGARPREDDYDDCPNAVPNVFKTASEQLVSLDMCYLLTVCKMFSSNI